MLNLYLHCDPELVLPCVLPQEETIESRYVVMVTEVPKYDIFLLNLIKYVINWFQYFDSDLLTYDMTREYKIIPRTFEST